MTKTTRRLLSIAMPLVSLGLFALFFELGVLLVVGEQAKFPRHVVGADFGVYSLSQDGYTTGQLTGIDIDQDGTVLARFSNGQSVCCLNFSWARMAVRRSQMSSPVDQFRRWGRISSG